MRQKKQNAPKRAAVFYNCAFIGSNHISKSKIYK